MVTIQLSTYLRMLCENHKCAYYRPLCKGPEDLLRTSINNDSLGHQVDGGCDNDLWMDGYRL